MKKILAVLLAVMMICAVVPFAASAEPAGTETATITIGSLTDVEAGDTVEITVSSDAAICGAQFTFDLGGLEFVSFVYGDNLEADGVDAEAGKVIIADIDDGFSSGVITATVPEDAEAEAVYTVSATGTFCNYDESIIDVTIVDGTVTVKAAEPAEPVLDEGITCTGSIQIGDSLGVVLTVGGTYADYDSYDITITRNVCNASYNFEEKIDTLDADDAYSETYNYMYVYSGLALYEMNIPMTVVINAYNDDVKVAFSQTFEFNPTVLLTNLYNSRLSKPSKYATTLYVVTDLLNLGTEAAKYFTNDKTKSCDLSGVAYANDGFSQTYASADVTADSLNTTSTSESLDGKTTLSALGAVTTAPSIAYTISGISDYTLSDLTIEVSYYSNYLGKTITQEECAENLLTNNKKTKYFFSFTGCCLYDGNKTLTCTVKNGETVLATSTYSVETVVAANIGTAIYQAIAKFGASARAYFGTT